ncbi:MAG TPA: hypothetical protein DEQ77_09225 [Candidatus Omnitrophica bacterium]|nr:hypothetical protein [Candidatus Omnitrophota bacterium]
MLDEKNKKGEIMEEKKDKPKILFYLLLNAVVVNIFWWFLFILGTHLTAKKSDYFNDTIAPIFDNVYSVCVLVGVTLIILALVVHRLNSSLCRTMALLGMWVSIITPSLPAIYYIILFCHGKANIPNLIVVPMAIGVSCFNLIMGKIFIIKPYQKNI